MKEFSFPDLLPEIPTAVQEIQTFFSSECNLESLIGFLQKDPVLSLHVLHLVNSPYYGLKTNVVSIRQAVTLLGGTMIRGIILAALMKKSFPLDLSMYKSSIEKLEMVTLLRIRFAQALSKHIGETSPNLLAKIFLMEDGKLITSFAIKQNNLQDIFTNTLLTKDVEETERETLGLTSYDAMGSLLEKWNFQESFAKSFFGISEPSDQEEEILHILSEIISMDGILENDETLEQALQNSKLFQENKSAILQITKNLREEIG